MLQILTASGTVNKKKISPHCLPSSRHIDKICKNSLYFGEILTTQLTKPLQA